VSGAGGRKGGWLARPVSKADRPPYRMFDHSTLYLIREVRVSCISVSLAAAAVLAKILDIGFS